MHNNNNSSSNTCADTSGENFGYPT